MEWFEIQAILKYQFYSYQEDWERTRFLAYLQVQSNSKKKWKLEDVIKFTWDDNSYDSDEENKTITKEQIQKLQQMANKYINQNKRKKLK